MVKDLDMTKKETLKFFENALREYERQLGQEEQERQAEGEIVYQRGRHVCAKSMQGRLNTTSAKKRSCS